MNNHTNTKAIFIIINVIIIQILSVSVYAFDFGKVIKNTTKEFVQEVEKETNNSTENSKSDNLDVMVKRVKTELRVTEKKMFSGKKSEALLHLQTAGALLNHLEGAKLDENELKILKTKYEKIKKDLMKRMGRKTSQSKENRKQKKPSIKVTNLSDKLPYHAKQKMREFDNLYRTAEYSLKKMEEAKHGDTTTPPEKYAKQIKEIIPKLQRVLDEAKTEAREKGVESHPDLMAAQEKIDAIPGRLQEISGEVKAVQSESAAKSAGIATDIDTLNKKFNILREKIFNKATGTPIYYNDLKPVKELLAVIEEFETSERKSCEEFLAEFSKKYGSTRDAVTKNTDDSSAGWNYENFKKGIENIDKTKSAMAEDLAKNAEQKIKSLNSMHDFYRIKQHSVIEEWIAVAEKFDSQNEKLKQVKMNLKQQLEADLNKFLKKIEKNKWPEHASNAPKNANELAKVALDWFKSSPDWGKREKQGKEPYEILAVAITGPWSVQKRNILGEPTMYGLPVKLAFQVESEKEKGLARVFDLTLRTFEGRDVKMAPPFEYPTVGNSSYILREAVK